jgi:hypothetical protein
MAKYAVTPRFDARATISSNISFYQSLKLFTRVSMLALAGAIGVVDVAASSAVSAFDDTLPLADKAEKLEFTVSEGTWMSLDLTSDGETIVFELLGDLYTMPITGGKATRILDGMGYAAQPRVSPDRKWIAFISDRDGSDNLWVASFEDGSLGKPRKLSGETYNKLISPTWMPDSTYVVMSKVTRGGGLTMHHVAGGDGLLLTPNYESEGGVSGIGAAVSPDGRYIYYAGDAGGFADFPTLQIYRFDMESGEEIQITQGEGGLCCHLMAQSSFMQHGGTQKLAFVSAIWKRVLIHRLSGPFNAIVRKILVLTVMFCRAMPSRVMVAR